MTVTAGSTLITDWADWQLREIELGERVALEERVELVAGAEDAYRWRVAQS